MSFEGKILSQDVVMRFKECTDISIPKAELTRAAPLNFSGIASLFLLISV